MARFFINRPIFAWVVSIVMMLAGAISISQLPIAQYPDIALPEVVISATYPGASAETLSNTVTQVIEQNMNGIDNMLYMTSESQSAGNMSLTLTFAAGTDPDIAQVQVQNKLSLATPQLPQEVQRQGLEVSKSTSTFLLVAGFISRDGSMNESDIADYVNTYLKDAMARLTGVGEVQVFGASRAMRIWVDPVKLSNYRLTLSDIEAVILRQNMQVSSGQLGGTPQTIGQQLNATVIAQSQLQTVEEFENIFIRVNQDGSSLRMRDIARVELGQESYATEARYNGLPAAGMGVKLATAANALNTADNVKSFLEEQRPFFPPGLDFVFPYDTTPFVSISITEVVKTLIEAIILVVLILYLFLQNFRTTLIPSIAVPVVLLATFAVLAGFGFTINTMTMLGMVLAIGMLVDDAIVVVENVERLIREEGMEPKEAAEKSMDQLTGALVGTALVLVAVFLPMAFFGGSTGVIYRQFSITISAAMTLSIVVAIVLTPALCATLLRKKDFEGGEKNTGFFGWYNRWFAKCVNAYESIVGHMIARWTRFLLMYGLIVFAMLVAFRHIPSSFLPDEDQGIMLVEVQLPPGAAMDRTKNVMKQVDEYFRTQETDTVEAVFYVCGFSFSGQGQNSALSFVRLKDWDDRAKPGWYARLKNWVSGEESVMRDRSVHALQMRAAQSLAGIRDANIYPIVPPAVMELGFATGFDLQLQDKGGVGHAELMNARNTFLAFANGPQYADRLQMVRPNGKEDTPQYQIEVDQAMAFSYGVALTDIHDMLQKGWGGGYINDFMDKGRIKKVYMQGEARARMLPEDFDKWYIRNQAGRMVPFGSLIKRRWIYGSPRLERYEGLPSAQIMGEPAPGISTGQAMDACEEIMQSINPDIGLKWTGLSFQEKQAGSQTTALYALSLVAIFLFLAALYESWTVPLVILLVIPIGILGVEFGALVYGLSNDVYFQVGFLTIIGLAAKNAILIVEFAKELHEKEGRAIVDATMEACRLRFRPIMMTVLTFILGVLPLAMSNGAGSGAQNAIGIGIVGGMVTNTFLGIFFVPLFFVLVAWLFQRRKTGN